MTETVIVIKSVSAGGLSMLLLYTFDDVEFVSLLLTGLFASVVSFFYDFAHKDNGNKFSFLSFTDLVKYIFYGVPVMFTIFYIGTLNTNTYINVPITVWGFLSMLCAGSAVTIVEFIAPILGNIFKTIANKLGGVK
jgi:hypothetical protein